MLHHNHVDHTFYKSATVLVAQYCATTTIAETLNFHQVIVWSEGYTHGIQVSKKYWPIQSPRALCHLSVRRDQLNLTAGLCKILSTGGPTESTMVIEDKHMLFPVNLL